jgi:hypothetical protein
MREVYGWVGLSVPTVRHSLPAYPSGSRRKAVPSFDSGRRCPGCSKALTNYNPGPFCYSCSTRKASAMPPRP